MPGILRINEGDFKYEVFYHSEFQGGRGDLDYLQIVRQPSYLKIPWCPVKTLEESKQKYDGHILEACQNLLLFYQKPENFIFEPDGFIRPRTTKPELQDPIVKISLETFHSMVDLSKELKDAVGLNKIKNVLVIDDVYASGGTVQRTISELRRGENFIVVCPLYVNQLWVKLCAVSPPDISDII
jgi:hypothetical protein